MNIDNQLMNLFVVLAFLVIVGAGLSTILSIRKYYNRLLKSIDKGTLKAGKRMVTYPVRKARKSLKKKRG